MIDLTPATSAGFMIAAIGAVIGVFGVLTKHRRDRLSRLIEQEEAELARRPAE